MSGIVDQLDGLPGAEIVRAGLDDLRAGRVTESALLVLVARPNLARFGIHVPEPASIERPFEHRLYELLLGTHGEGAYSRYNSLLRRLVSFERALSWRLRPERSGDA